MKVNIEEQVIKIESTYDCDILTDMINEFLQDPRELFQSDIDDLNNIKSEIRKIYDTFPLSTEE